MKENESKRFNTSFGHVTNEDYENDRHRDFSLRVDAPRKTVAKNTKKHKKVNLKERLKELINGLVLPDGSFQKESLSSQGLDSAKKELFGNVSIAVCVALMILVGLVMITSSSYYYCYNTFGDPFYNLNRQITNLLWGLGCFLVARFVPLKAYQRISFLAYVGSLFLCILVLIVGKSVNGSTRWLQIGSISFQPSETAKIGVALYISALVERFHDKMKTFRYLILLSIIIIIAATPVAAENLSTAIIIVLIGFSIMIVGGVDKWQILLLVLFAIVIGIGFIIFQAIREGVDIFTADVWEWGYRAKRIYSWLNRWENASDKSYQLVQSLYAVGSGGIFGRGLGESIQKLGFVPEAYNDIIFSIICEELGLVGAGIVVAIYTVFGYQGYTSAAKNPTLFGSGLITGITTMLCVQAFVNMGVAVGILPTTGASLPFISYGGSSAVFLLFGIGLLLNATRYKRKEMKQ